MYSFRTDSDDDESDVECVGEVGPETIDITAEDDLRAFVESCEDNDAPKGPIKAKGEFGIDDLPPIADLTITVPESECIQLGTVSGVVETLGIFSYALVQIISDFFANFIFALSLDSSAGRIATEFRCCRYRHCPVFG